MSKVIDAPADSSSVDIQPEDGFADFQAERRAAKPSVQVETPAKDAPASDPVEGAAPAKDAAEPKPAEALTDEEKSARKRANDERRWTRLNRELGATKAELERLKSSGAPAPVVPAASTTAKTKVTDDNADDPRPKQDDFTDFDEYVDARSSWNARSVLRDSETKRAAETHAKTAKEQAESFMDKVGTYAEAHEGYMDAFETVRDGLETDLPSVSTAIADYEKSVELIDRLGTDEALFQRILDHKANPARALMELGKIIATFEAESTPVAISAEPKPTKTLPRAPAVVGARRPAPTGESVLDDMASKDELPLDWRSRMPRKDGSRR